MAILSLGCHFAGDITLEKLKAYDSSRAAADDMATITESKRAAVMERLLSGAQKEQEAD